MKTVTLRMAVTITLLTMVLFGASAQTTQPIRTALTTNNMMNAPFADGIVIWNAAAGKWSNGVNTASSTNLPSYLTTAVLTNLAATGISPGATNASAYIASQSGIGTNTTLWGVINVAGTQTNWSTLDTAGAIQTWGGVAAYDSGFASYDGVEHLTLTAASAALDTSLDPFHISWNGNWFVDFSTNTSIFYSNLTVNGNLQATLDAAIGGNLSVTGNVTIAGATTNTSTSGGGFWTYDSIGFISISSPNDYMYMSHPQGGIFSTLDGWGLGMADGTPIWKIYTNALVATANANFEAHLGVGAAGRYYFAADAGQFYLFDSVLGTAPISVSDVDSTVAIQVGLTVPAVAYGPSWDGNTLVPTMDAVYDKIESLSLGSGGGGAGSLPMDSTQFTTNSIVTIKNGALETNVSIRGLTIPNVTASRVAAFNSSGNLTNSQNVDLTEIEYLDGVTSAIQTQLNNKMASATNANQFLGNPLSIKDGATFTNISSRGVTIPSITASRVLVINSSGNITNSQGVDLNEIEYLDGVTSSIQNQFASKLSSSTNGNQFLGVPLSIKDGARLTNTQARGITLLSATASRPAYIDASGNITNASGTPDGTKFMRDDGALVAPPGSTNPVVLTAGYLASSNWFGSGYTNTGSNASQTIDMMGPQVIRSKISGNTAFTLVNMDLWTNAAYGSTIRWDIDMAVPGSAVTFTTLHPINWGKGSSPFLSNGDTNFLTIAWNGSDVIGSYSHAPWVYEYSSGSTLVFDAAYGPAIHSDTNRLTANTTCILTNLENGTTLQANFIGDSGSSDYTATFIPHLGTLIVNMDTLAQSKTNSFTITCSNKQVTEVYGTVAKLNGTNLLKMSVSRASFQ